MNTLHEINTKAHTLLRSSLGPVDYTRYVQQFSTGSGDYTAERQQKAEEDTEDVAKRVAVMKAQGLLQPPPKAQVMK